MIVVTITANTVQSTAKLGVVQNIFKKHFFQFEKGAARQQTVTAGLMLGADALDAKIVGHVLQAAL